MANRRQFWDEVKKQKEQIALPKHSNSELITKAKTIAMEILKFRFVIKVGLFGSAARGEDGRDIDLLIIDDGTVSIKALNDLLERAHYCGFSSGGAYADACYLAFAEHMPGESFAGQLSCDFYQYLDMEPAAIDLIFVGGAIWFNQQYLNALVINGNGPYFFNNISDDALLFDPKSGKFGKDVDFPKFVNRGVPSPEVLARILEEMHNRGDDNSNLGVKPLTKRSSWPAGENILPRIILSDSKYKEDPHTSNVVRFDQIGGQPKAKEKVMSLCAALKNPERYSRWGTKPPRGICLYGPSGNGKTLLAKALATETKVPFYIVDASELVSMWYGEAEKNIDRIFAKARGTGGILFFDEADSLASSRGAPQTHEATKRMVAALCRNMDGFRTSDKVVVFFATNRKEDMDPAVLRPGRTDLNIEVSLPDRDGRKQIFEIHIKKAEEMAGRQLFEGLDVESLLEKTNGYSGADIAEIIRRTLEEKVKEEDRGGGSPGPVVTKDVVREINSYERVKEDKAKIGLKQ